MSEITKEEVITLLQELKEQAMRSKEQGNRRWRTLEEAVRLVLSAPRDTKGWHIDNEDTNRAYIKLTEHHELCVNFTGEGIVMDNVDQRLGDVVDTRCFDLEDLNCVMDEEEL